jgi:hypothetical protein
MALRDWMGLGDDDSLTLLAKECATMAKHVHQTALHLTELIHQVRRLSDRVTALERLANGTDNAVDRFLDEQQGGKKLS